MLLQFADVELAVEDKAFEVAGGSPEEDHTSDVAQEDDTDQDVEVGE